MKDALALRKKIKKTKPVFVVKESKFSARVKKRWRFPRGMHSKVRQQHKGRAKLPGPGFSSPRSVRGLHASGLAMVTIHTLKELEKINPEKQGIYIGTTVGNRKRVILLAKTQELKITVLNHNDVAKAIQIINDDLAARKKKKAVKSDSKSKKQAEKKKKAEEKSKETVEDKIKTEEKKEKEKKEAEKVIIKK